MDRPVATTLLCALTIAVIRRRASRPPFREGIVGDIEAAVSSLHQTPSRILSLYAGSQWLNLPVSLEKTLTAIFVIAIGIQVSLIAIVVGRRVLRRHADTTNDLRGSRSK